MIDLYTAGTGNTQRAAIIVEEAGLPCTYHKLDLSKGETRTPDFLAINPAGQVPVLVDGSGPERIVVAQSAAIVLYVAEKVGRFLPKEPAARATALQWLMQAASDCSGTSGALFQLGNVVPEKTPSTVAHFENRLIAFFTSADRQLAGRDYLAGEISVADFALYPVVAGRMALVDRAGTLGNLKRWAAAMAARPSVQKGMASA
jgi:GST-like protein